MIKDVKTLSSKSSTAQLFFEIPLSEAPAKVQREKAGQETCIYSKPVMLLNRGKYDKTVENAKARFKKSDKDLQMIVVELKLPEDFDFDKEFGTQAERMKKSYEAGHYGTCIVPAHWKHLPDYEPEGKVKG